MNNIKNNKNKTNNTEKEPIYLAKGKRSNVFLTEIIIKKNKKSKKIKAIMKKSIPSLQHTKSRIQHEANILKFLNKHKIGPKLYNYRNNELIEEYIEGETIEKFIEFNLSSNKKVVIKVMKQILNQCRTLDKLKINKEEMSNPYKHIIIKVITKNKRTILKLVMIDFERARYSESPTNVTQFFQYLMHHKLVKFDEETKQLLKNYKNTQSEKNYKKLLCLL